MSVTTTYNDMFRPKDFSTHIPPLKPFTKTSRHIISYGSSHSSQFGGYKLDDRPGPKTVIWHSSVPQGVKTQEKVPSVSAINTKTHKASEKTRGSNTDQCPLHSNVRNDKKTSAKRTPKHHYTKKSGHCKRKMREGHELYSKKPSKAYVPITAPKSVLASVSSQWSSGSGAQSVPVPGPSPYKAKRMSTSLSCGSVPSYKRTTLWKDTSQYTTSPSDTASLHAHTQPDCKDYLKTHVKDVKRSVVGKCDAVEILDTTIDSLTDSAENGIEVCDNEQGSKYMSSFVGLNPNGATSRFVNRFRPQPKQIRNFTFRALTQTNETVGQIARTSLSGLLADKRYSLLRGLLQSRGPQPKAPAPSAASHNRRSLCSRDSEASFMYRAQRQDWNRAQTWTPSVTCSESLWAEWQTVASVGGAASKASKYSSGADVVSSVELPDIVTTRTESRAATRGSVMSPTETLLLNLDLEDDFDDGEKRLTARKNEEKPEQFPQPWNFDEANNGEDNKTNMQTSLDQSRPSHESSTTNGKLGITETLDNADSRTCPSENNTRHSFRARNEGGERSNFDIWSLEQDKYQQSNSFSCQDPEAPVHSKNTNSESYRQCSPKYINHKNSHRSFKTKSILKSKSAKYDRKLIKYENIGSKEGDLSEAEISPLGMTRAYTAVCMGTSSFEPINRRYATRSSQSQRNKVMFAPDDYVGYQHRKFSKGTKAHQVAEKNYDDKTKAEFINVKIGEDSDVTDTDSDLSVENSTDDSEEA